ncbi:hypothetical protein BLNAU_4193 [Blattamonas nauphoetae]|uniref:Uncharacterized protein n=1 Tax=Blattamonas nauphoetae TaxID=2049346 RepID=A0ABQ9YAL9_9EUKA|nr:hypothetical protein BLNAU_4193 [Blattamonas nauphoetae]
MDNFDSMQGQDSVSMTLDHLSEAVIRGEDVGIRAIMLNLRTGLPQHLRPPINYSYTQIKSACLRNVSSDFTRRKNPVVPHSFLTFRPVRHLMVIVSISRTKEMSSSESYDPNFRTLSIDPEDERRQALQFEERTRWPGSNHLCFLIVQPSQVRCILEHLRSCFYRELYACYSPVDSSSWESMLKGDLVEGLRQSSFSNGHHMFCVVVVLLFTKRLNASLEGSKDTKIEHMESICRISRRSYKADVLQMRPSRRKEEQPFGWEVHEVPRQV